MPAFHCPHCRKPVKDPERLELHYSHSIDCREEEERLNRAITSERSEDELSDLPVAANELGGMADMLASASEPDRAENEGDAAVIADLGLLPAELELFERMNEALLNQNAPLRLDLDEAMADIELEVGAELPQPPPRANQRRFHGYATIEVHPNAARVYRWGFEDEQGENPVNDELRSKKIFEICEWLMRVGVSNTDRAEFLNFELNRDKIPFRTPSDMLKHIDSMEHGPEWTEFTLTVETDEGRETFVIYRRNPLEVIRYLIRQKRFKDHMGFGPERHWTITLDGRRIRVYSEMWTGDWWWRLQDLLGEGATLAPFILATDETNMTQLSGSKVAWPVYGSIGNISSHIRRRPSEHAMVLIGYLPIAKLNWITNNEERRQQRWNLYHSALSVILEPLRKAARNGEEMLCSDGWIRRVHPILATHLGDWPEMCLFGTCRKTGCPLCTAEDNMIEVFEPAARLRTKLEVLSAFRLAHGGYADMQGDLLLRPTWPYWGLHPWASGPGMIVPDILHQLWKGVFLDQICPWWTKLIGTPEMDQRFACVPQYPSLQHFGSGLSVITQWSGNEARAVAKVFLGIIAGDTPEMGVEAARAVLDFTFRARQPQLDEDDLNCLDSDVRVFHATREIFITRQVYTGEDFNNFSKMHMMGHYAHQIREWGAPDGYNTEGPERLHIDYVKTPYHTTSGVNPEPQMTKHLQRIEALGIRRAELERDGTIKPRKRRYRPDDDADGLSDDSEDELEIAQLRGTATVDAQDNEQGALPRAREQEAYQPKPEVAIAREPTSPIVPVAAIIEDYGATGFLQALRLYFQIKHVDLAYIITQEPTFGVYHKFALIHPPLPFSPLGGSRRELVRACPARYGDHGIVKRAAFFDTVLIESDYSASGIYRYCPARVLVIFQLHRRLWKQHAEVMAYVELFEEFSPDTAEHHALPVTKPLYHGNQRARLVIPISDIRLTCHLSPDYARLRRRYPDRRWDSSTDILSFADRFYLSRHANYFFFALMDHWRRIDAHRRQQARQNIMD
ncbi:unnamed protein product [Rhizoctonia solani]|uniref:Uncharacterized protein n=1 Tax=Rhizoctonia solani TaxID=456999 RepID=A0A8H3ACH9_9AGAM|nr:unnamed protein product [Rhizoctonia solani]